MLDRKGKKIPMKTEDPRLACVCRSVSPLRLKRISDELINGEEMLAGVKGPWKKKKKKDTEVARGGEEREITQTRGHCEIYANCTFRRLFHLTFSLGLITDAGSKTAISRFHVIELPVRAPRSLTFRISRTYL